MAQPNHVDKDALLEKFKELGIDALTVDHPEVFTVEEMMPHVQHLPGVQCKNLFLRDKKKKGLWLFSARHDLEVKLNELSKQVNAPGGLRFADEAILQEKLGVKQGCVTAYALINDKNNEVKFICDDALINGGYERVYFHPLTNAATTGITPQDFQKFLDHVGHQPLLVKMD